MFYLIGVAHRVQSKQKEAGLSADQKQFLGCLEEAIKKLKPLLIAEEFSEFALKKPVFRIVANTQASMGATGYTTGLAPSMSLGCGAYAGNITSDNITPLHLINVKRLAYELHARLSYADVEEVFQGGLSRHSDQ